VEGDDVKSVVAAYVAEVLNGGDMDAAARLVADETLRHRVAAFRAAFPDLRVAPKALLAEGDLVAGHFTGEGTHRGVFEGCPPTGRPWTASCTAIYRVHGAQIVDFHVTWDLLALMEQLDCIRRVATVSA
jgi:predicted ester cyclase